MISASEALAWVHDNPGLVLRYSLRTWSESRPGSPKRYLFAEVGPHRFYLGARPELRDRFVNYAAEIRKYYFGANRTLREMMSVWTAARKFRPSWKRLRNSILSERGAYFKNGRIRRRRASAHQTNQPPST